VPSVAGFDSWAGGLSTVEGQLGQLGPSLAGIQDSRASLDGPLAQAVADYQSTTLQGSMTTVLAEFTQPNPLGTKLPYSFTVAQLPSQTSPTTTLLPGLVTQINAYLQWLWTYLRTWGGVPQPGPLG
jgi:hypothetical protein